MNTFETLLRRRYINNFFKDYQQYDLNFYKCDINFEGSEEEQEEKRCSNFKEITIKVTNNKLLKDLNIFLRKLGNYQGKGSIITAKAFLSSFIIVSDFEAISSTGEEDSKLISCAEEMLRSFFVLKLVSIRPNRYINDFISDFITKADNFNKVFAIWRENDIQNLLGTLFVSYYQIKDMIDNIDNMEDENSPYKQISKDGFSKQLEEIKSSIKLLDPENGIQKLEEYESTLQKVAVSDDIRDVAEKAYWDMISEDLRQDPPNFDTIVQLIEEISQKLQEITPSREDLKDSIKNSIDIDLIRQQIKHNAFGPEEIVQLVNYIFSRIRDYEAAERNKETDEILENFKNTMNTSEILKFDEILPDLFQKAYNKLDQIKEDMIAFVEGLEERNGGMFLMDD